MDYERRKKQKEEKTKQLYERVAQPQGLARTFDFIRYAHFLENTDLTEEQKHELLQAAWNIAVEFVSLRLRCSSTPTSTKRLWKS